jgi:NAD(P)-dependent dehydrogenase (short-subunit alcohol dehydrogenase family)
MAAVSVRDLYTAHVNPTLGSFLKVSGRDVVFVRASGAALFDEDGARWDDFVAGFGSLPFGHNPPALKEALKAHLGGDAPTLLVESVNPLAGELAARLVAAAPGLETCSFTNSGAEAVEAALKTALLATGRGTVLYASGGYHGTTLGALSCMARGPWREGLESVLAPFVEVPFGDLDALESALARGDAAAFLIEPVQMEAGARVAPAAYLRGAAEACRRHGALLVLDEVQTGMGRTGRLFACEHAGVVPDLLVLAKALGGGLVPIGAALMRQGLWRRAWAGSRDASSWPRPSAGTHSPAASRSRRSARSPRRRSWPRSPSAARSSSPRFGARSRPTVAWNRSRRSASSAACASATRPIRGPAGRASASRSSPGGRSPARSSSSGSTASGSSPSSAATTGPSCASSRLSRWTARRARASWRPWPRPRPGSTRMADGARCLVFGGSGAVGGAVCRALANEGARVVFTYHQGEETARRLLEELPGSRAYALDLRSAKAIAETIARAADDLSGLDAFVQCAAVAVPAGSAGRTSHHRMPEIDESGWDEVLAVNTKSAFFAVRSLIPLMEKGGGNVVLIGSVDGVKPVPSPVHYAASKGALRGMAQAMAKELGGLGIRVNVVAPGVLEDGISRNLPEQLRKEYLKHCGLGRAGRLSEMASLVAFLALGNTYVTGQTILLDGAL